MQWFKKTAQGFNPGSVGKGKCPESGTRICGRIEESKYEYRGHVCRAPLFLLRPLIPNYGGQAGRIGRAAYPGLKPWAVLLDHFIVKDSHGEWEPNSDRFDPR